MATRAKTNITPLRPTRPQLLDFIREGWEHIEYLGNPEWDTSGYYGYDDHNNIVCGCATGAGALAAGVQVSLFEHWCHLADLDCRKLADLSDSAGSKEKALQAIEGYIAYIDGWLARMHNMPLSICPWSGFEEAELEFFGQWNCGYVDCIKATADAERRKR